MTFEEPEMACFLRDKLMEDGYSFPVAEALSENGVTVEQAATLSKCEVLDYYLTWNGIHGYTETILAVIANAEENLNV